MQPKDTFKDMKVNYIYAYKSYYMYASYKAIG